MATESLFEQIDTLIEAGQRGEAYALVKRLLAGEPDSIRGWELLARLTGQLEEAELAQQQLTRIRAAGTDAPIDADRQPTEPEEDRQVVRRAVALAKAGQRDEARALVERVIGRSPENPDAWVVLAQLAPTREEASEALREVLRLDPDNVWARTRLERLTSRAGAEDEQDEDRPLVGWLLAAGGGLLIVGGLLVLALLRPLMAGGRASEGTGTPEAAVLEEVANLPMSACKGLVDRALSVSDSACRTIGTNQVCYGSYRVDAQLAPGVNAPFNLVGDVVPLNALTSIYASPLDVNLGQWGIAVMRLQANLPRTIPGQSVTLLVFGNTTVDNASGDMQTFYFSTGLGAVTCGQVPFDGLLLDAPEGTGVAFNANGTDFNVVGTALMDAQAFGQMVINVVSGTATIGSGSDQIQLNPGEGAQVDAGRRGWAAAAGAAGAGSQRRPADRAADELCPAGGQLPAGGAGCRAADQHHPARPADQHAASDNCRDPRARPADPYACAWPADEHAAA